MERVIFESQGVVASVVAYRIHPAVTVIRWGAMGVKISSEFSKYMTNAKSRVEKVSWDPFRSEDACMGIGGCQI